MPNFKLWFYGALALLLIGMSGTIAYLNARIDASKAENKLLSTRLDTQEAVNRQLTQDQEQIRQLTRDLNNEFARSDQARRALARRVEAMDLRGSAMRDPTETEILINRDTLWTNRCNEIATGDVITEEDKTNEVCPELVQ